MSGCVHSKGHLVGFADGLDVDSSRELHEHRGGESWQSANDQPVARGSCCPTPTLARWKAGRHAELATAMATTPESPATRVGTS